MGSRSSGSGSSGGGGGFDFARGAVTNPVLAAWNQQALQSTIDSIDKNIKDPQLRAEMKAAVEKMSKEMGGLPGGSKGFEVTVEKLENSWAFGKTQGNSIKLQKSVYGKSYEQVEATMKEHIKKGNVTSTKKPAVKTFVHEIGHKYHDALSPSGKYQVEQIYNQFKSSNSTKGWGKYSKKSAGEFYADAVAKSVLGSSDKWTKALGRIK